jgi:hypothetical protein
MSVHCHPHGLSGLVFGARSLALIATIKLTTFIPHPQLHMLIFELCGNVLSGGLILSLTTKQSYHDTTRKREHI